jgi:hypothetical protein
MALKPEDFGAIPPQPSFGGGLPRGGLDFRVMKKYLKEVGALANLNQMDEKVYSPEFIEACRASNIRAQEVAESLIQAFITEVSSAPCDYTGAVGGFMRAMFCMMAGEMDLAGLQAIHSNIVAIMPHLEVRIAMIVAGHDPKGSNS